jgi:multidrug efflux pump subunit AcrB
MPSPGDGVSAVGRLPQITSALIVAAQGGARPRDIAAVVVGHGLRVRDVATVAWYRGPRTHHRLRRQVYRTAQHHRQPGGNTLEIVDSVASLAAPSRHSAGVTLKPVYDQGALVRDAMKSVRDAMIIGAVLAVLILLLFRARAHHRIGAPSIPLTLAIMFAVI